MTGGRLCVLLPLLPLLLLLLLPMSVPVTGSCGVVCCCYHYALVPPARADRSARFSRTSAALDLRWASIGSRAPLFEVGRMGCSRTAYRGPRKSKGAPFEAAGENCPCRYTNNQLAYIAAAALKPPSQLPAALSGGAVCHVPRWRPKMLHTHTHPSKRLAHPRSPIPPLSTLTSRAPHFTPQHWLRTRTNTFPDGTEANAAG